MNSTQSEQDEKVKSLKAGNRSGKVDDDVGNNEDENNDEGSDDGNNKDDVANGDSGVVNGAAKKKKKKKSKKKPKATGQTNPPSIPIGKLFPDENFPIGEIQDYPKAMDK